MLEENQKPMWDWIEFIVRLTRALGFNSVQVRWKLMAWRESWGRTQRQAQSSALRIGYKHKICPHCGNVQDRGNRVCDNCGRALRPRFLEILNRLGLVSFRISSVSSLLTALIMICYARTALAEPDFNFLSIDSEILFRFGANFPPAVQSGEWWRLSTYIFLHANLMHILFNLIALQQIGPQIEEIFGKGRMLFFFMLTGIVAGFGSEILRAGGVGIGASGSLMGLIGLAAGWGHKSGTTAGREVRNLMIQWGIYTLAFGFFFGADNSAHIAGFVCGALLGLINHPRWEKQENLGDQLMAWSGTIMAIGTVLLVLFPPNSNLLSTY